MYKTAEQIADTVLTKLGKEDSGKSLGGGAAAGITGGITGGALGTLVGDIQLRKAMGESEALKKFVQMYRAHPNQFNQTAHSISPDMASIGRIAKDALKKVRNKGLIGLGMGTAAGLGAYALKD